MSKKSYMNTKNILSEGLINKLIGILIPKKVREKMKKSKIEKVNKKIEKLGKEVSDLSKKQSDAKERMIKALEKQYGTKIKRQSAEKAIKDFYGE